MNSLLDSDPYHDNHTGADREISLGTPTILGIFFALALVCAGFFGFGYTLGRKSAQTVILPDPLSASAPASSSPSGPSIIVKPSAGSAAASSSAGETTVSSVLNRPTPADKNLPSPAIVTAEKSPAPPTPSATVGPPSAAPTQQPAISPGGSFMVQIAAVSTQEIADIETTALKKYGFDVFVRHEPQDQLLHVQIGPYATRKDAVAMQQIVLARGFNAIVK